LLYSFQLELEIIGQTPEDVDPSTALVIATLTPVSEHYFLRMPVYDFQFSVSNITPLDF
jgi:hypothetical protein